MSVGGSVDRCVGQSVGRCARPSVDRLADLLVKSSKQGREGMLTGRQAGRQGKQKPKEVKHQVLNKIIRISGICLASFVLILVFEHVSKRT